MLYPYEERHPKWQFAFVFNINRCLACQTCSMADKSTWLFSKGQEIHVVEQRGNEALRRLSQFYDVKITQLIRAGEPGGPGVERPWWTQTHAPYGVFEGMTIFDAGAKVGQAAIGYIPTDQEWRFVTSMRIRRPRCAPRGRHRQDRILTDEPWKMTGSSLPGA